jgi:hypothetical protein
MYRFHGTFRRQKTLKKGGNVEQGITREEGRRGGVGNKQYSIFNAQYAIFNVQGADRGWLLGNHRGTRIQRFTKKVRERQSRGRTVPVNFG